MRFDAAEVKARLADQWQQCWQEMGTSPAKGSTPTRAQFLCPFHADSNPSLSYQISGEWAGWWKCFGCKRTGTLLDALGMHWGLDPKTSFGELLERAGEWLGLNGSTPGRGRPRTRRNDSPQEDDAEEADDPPAARHSKKKTKEEVKPTFASAAERRASLGQAIDNLHGPHGQTALRWLREIKGLTDETIANAFLGLERNGHIVIPYFDLQGKEILKLKYYRPRTANAEKDIYQEKPGITRLYGWKPEFAELSELVLCGSEFDCLLLQQNAFAAFFTGSEGTTVPEEDLPELGYKRVCIFADNDAAGRKASATWRDWVYGLGGRPVVCRWPEEVGERGDADDYFVGLGKTAQDFADLLKSYRPSGRVLSIAELVSHDLSQGHTEYLVDRVLYKTGMNLFYGKRGSLKGWAGLEAGVAAASGQAAWGHYPVDEPQKVYAIYAESELREMGRRAEKLVRRAQFESRWDMFDIEAVVHLDLKNAKEQLHFERLLKARKPGLVIFDPLTRLHRGKESDRDDMQPLMDYFGDLSAELNCAILLIHHDRKRLQGLPADEQDSDDVRGSSAIADSSDGIYRIVFKRGPEARERCQMVCEKSRKGLLENDFYLVNTAGEAMKLDYADSGAVKQGDLRLQLVAAIAGQTLPLTENALLQSLQSKDRGLAAPIVEQFVNEGRLVRRKVRVKERGPAGWHVAPPEVWNHWESAQTETAQKTLD